MERRAEVKKNRPSLASRLPFYLFVGAMTWFIFAFLLYPNAALLKDIFWQDGQFSLSAFHKIMASDRAKQAIMNSVKLAFTLTVTVNVVGTFLVLVTEYFEIKGAKWLLPLFMSTLVFGGIVFNNGYIYTYGTQGVVTNALLKVFPSMPADWFKGYVAVVLVMTFGVTTNHMIFLRNAVKGLDFHVIEAAQNLGSSQWEILRKVVFPSLKPVLLTLVIMTFQAGIGAMSAPLMVGGKDFQTISPLILTFASRPSSRELAATLSLILGLVQMALLALIVYNESRGNYLSISKTQTRIRKQPIKNKAANVIVHGLSYLLGVIYALPLVIVVLYSFMDFQGIVTHTLSWEHFTLDNYARILGNVNNYRPLVTSFVFAGLAAVGSVLFMLVVVRLLMRYRKKRWLGLYEFAFYIPWLLPPLLLALGLLIAYDHPSLLIGGAQAVGSLWVLPLAYLLVNIPNSLRYLKASYYSFDENLEDASRVLGASGVRTFFKVVLPALLPVALALVAINFTGRLADYDLSAFLYHPTMPTLGIIIRANSDPSAAVDAKAINLVYSVLLIFVNTIIMYLVYGRGTEAGLKKGGRTD